MVVEDTLPFVGAQVWGETGGTLLQNEEKNG
jgi:hypothetical protein